MTWRLAPILALALLVSACSQTTGDFGRAPPQGLTTSLRPTLDRVVTAANGGRVSDLPQSDEEKGLDARLWRFYHLAHADGTLLGGGIDLDRKALLSGAAFETDLPQYYQALSGRNFRSTHTIYHALQADIDADLAVLPATFEAICAVQDLDRKRGVAVAGFDGLSDKDRLDVALRRDENRGKIDLFVKALDFRYQSYSYALKRLLLDAPYKQATGVDASLSEMATALGTAREGSFCPGDAASQAMGKGSGPVQL
jgi:hypothetical protein